MNETDKYILDAIEAWVWSGFYDPSEVNRMIDDILENDADEKMLRAAVQPAFDRKSVAEASWPEETDCDRLDRAFNTLNLHGVIALHNAGYTMSDGLDDVGDVLRERGRSGVIGYCFYHGQDVERAVGGGGLFIAFGDLDSDKSQKAEVGAAVREILQQHLFRVEWDGDSETRLEIPDLDWKRRYAGPV
jgi:Domain of unknown function (DUF6891)